MKKKTSGTSVMAFVSLCFVLMAGTAISQTIAINSTGANAAASSILDVSSTTNGLLIPRMTTTQRNAISTPATGLMIWNTTDSSLNQYRGTSGWYSLQNTGSEWSVTGNAGTTAGANFIGTTDARALVVKTNNTSRINVSSAGITTIGDGTNQTSVEADGTITLQGSATVFKDLLVPVFSTSNSSSNPPSLGRTKDNGSGSQGVFTYYFSGSTEQELYFLVQMPHDWKEGSTIFPHVHWTANTTLGTTKVRWGLEYTWVNITGTLENTSIIYGEDLIAPVGTVTAYKHAITELAASTGIIATGKTLSSFIMCRIFRDATAGTDNYSGSAALLGIDFHMETDALGSRSAYSK